MADQWLLHTELMRSCIWLIHGYCTRSCIWLQYTTAAKELLRRGLLRRGLLRRNCCEQTAANGADQELHLAAVYDGCERTAEKGTAAKGTAAYGSCCSPAAKEMLRRKC